MRMKLTIFLTKEHSSLYIIPTIYTVYVYKSENVPLVVINISSDNIYLPKGEIMGFKQCQSLNVSEITSPADIDIHRKVDLQDAEITKEQQMLLRNYVMNTKISF